MGKKKASKKSESEAILKKRDLMPNLKHAMMTFLNGLIHAVSLLKTTLTTLIIQRCHSKN